MEMKVKVEMKMKMKMEAKLNVKTASRIFTRPRTNQMPLQIIQGFIKLALFFLTPCMRSEATTISKVQRNTTILPRMNIDCEAALQLVSSFDSDFTCAFIMATTETTMAMVERRMSKAPMMIAPVLRLVQPKQFFRRSSGSIIGSSISKFPNFQTTGSLFHRKEKQLEGED